MSLNACLHALGSVEFLLQKKKRSLKGFEGWFVAWKARLKTDAVMKWVRSARDKVVHEEDLETYSVSRVSVVCTYDDATKKVIESLRPQSASQVAATGYERVLNVPPRMNKRETLRLVGSASIPESVLNQASIVWERRWVEEHLPDWELLMCLAYAYSVLAEMMHEAHNLDGIAHEVSLREGEHIHIVSMSDPEFQDPPCMSSTRSERSMEIDLETDAAASVLQRKPIALTEEVVTRAVDKFGQPAGYPPHDPKSALDWVQPVMEVAKQIVAAGSEHEWHVMFFQGGLPRQHNSIHVDTRSEKRRAAQDVAELCAALGFDGALSVGEMWQAPITDAGDGTAVPPVDHPDRKEGLIVDAECADGSKLGICQPFVRGADASVTFGEQFTIDAGAYNFFAPVRAVWQAWREG